MSAAKVIAEMAWRRNVMAILMCITILRII